MSATILVRLRQGWSALQRWLCERAIRESARQLSRRVWLTLARNGLISAAHLQQNRVIRLEAASTCQLRCPLCITGVGETRPASAALAARSVGWGVLSLANFTRFLDAHPEIRAVELSNYGEIFLNRDLVRILALAHARGVAISAANGTNLNYLSDEQAEALVLYAVRKIKVSIDGVTEESYGRYRVGGSLERVLGNVRRINAAKLKFASPYPKLKWQFIVFGHNEHELPEARRLAESLGMGFKAKLNFTPKFSPVRNPDLVREYAGAASIAEYEREHDELYSPACLQLWTAPQVNWDGKLLGCCVNHFGDFGNVFETNLETQLRSERYVYARRMVLGEVPPREDVPCTRCRRYSRVRQMPFRASLLRALSQEFP